VTETPPVDRADGPNATTTGPATVPADAVLSAARAQLSDLLAQPLAPGLYIVATPIGHLADLTLRALATLASVDRIYCEDTRHSLRLTTHYGITRPLSPYHEHNAATVRPRIVKDLTRGARLALISDAGTPLISDPGYKLARDVLDAGARVWAVPGPSAVLAALTVAGLPTDRFNFAGFLPPKAAARRTRLELILGNEMTTVLFEAPSRLADTLAELAVLAPTRLVAVARELTKLHETVARGQARDVAAALANADIKGECVVLVAPATAAPEIDDATLTSHLKQALATSPLSAAVRAVAADHGLPRKRVYDLALALKAEQPKQDPQ
jgi:16S rRNA (cytidine1402-2'-O)-methyltransferase